MEKSQAVGSFIKETKKPVKDPKTKEVVGYDAIYSLHTHLVCSDELVLIIKDWFAYDADLECWYVWEDNNPPEGCMYWRKINPGFWRAEFKNIFRGETTANGDLLGCQVSFFNGVIAMTQDDFNCRVPQVDKKFINFRNGVLDIESVGKRGSLVAATPQNSQRWQVPFDYIPTAWPNFFLDWLNDVLGDAGLVRYVQALINTIIKRRSDLQFFTYFYGSTGRNGKGTLVRIMQALVADSDQVNTSFKILSDSLYEFGRLLGVSLVHFGEEKSFNNLQPLKQITGRDKVTGRSKHSNNYIEGVCTCQTLVVSNSYMQIPQDDAGPIAGRIRTVHFKRQFTAAQQAEWLAEGGEGRLMDELPGIVNWALSLTDTEVTEAIMVQCPAMHKANLAAEVAGNGLTGWVSEYLVYAQGARTLIGSGKESIRNGIKRFGNNPDNDETQKLYPHYLAYCRDDRLANPLSSKKFTAAVVATANRLFGVSDIDKSKRTKNGYYIDNIRLKTELELENEG